MLIILLTYYSPHKVNLTKIFFTSNHFSEAQKITVIKDRVG